MSIGRFFKFIFYTALFLFFCGAVTAYFMGIVPTSFGIHSKIYNSGNVAMARYDIVNYYNKKDANMGDIIFNYKLGEENWFFTSARNLRLFKKKPKKYIPQYGGYCVYTVSKGYTHPPDPKVWHMKSRRLYFFKDEETKQIALTNWDDVIANANLHWKN